MIKDFFKGINIGLGFTFCIGLLFSLVYAVGFHTADEILGGTFLGDYEYNGNVNFSNANVVGIGKIPSGAILAFNLTECPEGWSNATLAEGRYIVGLNPGGSLENVVGTSLTDLENRPTGNHRHDGTLYNSASGRIIEGAGSIVATNSAGTSSKNTQDGTINDPPEGTNAPYIQYLYCIKD